MFCNNCPLTEEEHERLRMATPVTFDGCHHVGNERLRPKQLSFRTRRFCPHCLADKPYHRIQWDVVAASHCRTHGNRLVSQVGEAIEMVVAAFPGFVKLQDFWELMEPHDKFFDAAQEAEDAERANTHTAAGRVQMRRIPTGGFPCNGLALSSGSTTY